MTQRRRLTRLLVACAALVLPAAFLPAAHSSASDDLTATFTKNSDWGTGFGAEYTITNDGDEAVSGWTLEFDLASTQSITSVWNGVHQSDGDHQVITNASWNGDIAPGASVTVGFNGTYSGTWTDPTGCTINGAPCDGNGGGEPPEPPATPGNVEVTGVTATSVSLTWDASDDADNYLVYVDGDLQSSPTSPQATVGGLTPETSYEFTVAAENAAGVSDQSAPVTAETLPPGTGPGDERLVGYFTQWGIYGRDFLVRDLHTSGAAEELTHINYAFGNVSENSECFIVNQEGVGDAWADYQRGFNANESVDGEADQWDQELKGNFNQLKKLKEMYPDLKVYISLGGWTWSTYFSDAALPENREDFVESCIDLYLRGNLPVQGGDPAGGEGSAFGVFDGIDLDWEWPASEGQEGNIVRPEDRENFTALVEEFRTQLDDLEAETGRTYDLTAFLPADPRKIDAGYEVNEIFDHLDFATVQGYDFHGAWESTTNHHANLYDTPGDPSPVQFSVDTAIQEYLSGGAAADELVIGIPYYGRGWTGVSDGGNDGLFQESSGPAPGTWEEGIEDYKVLTERSGERFRDESTGALWLYDGTEWWSYDDPTQLTQKTGYIQDNGLGGAMVWSLDGDDADATLTKTLGAGLAN
ncbi:glycoside hydrolase [Actinobacteria bacterium YIM 96077]|uniref:chitinase n=1 Tax=Phytoactinopolyspora halophila TaxID=1981511 RepID=A0A329R3I9_9ACTN|nr:glycoside hydrolase family 18 chitinase [Phytoactinopolyspora halophila]AYY12177.1 glycoside hydrolase [Actinobacteria bacterium YIM 96077]RAW18589.1 glycoside hydrolase [Phytoactinopolyspora halophila]